MALEFPDFPHGWRSPGGTIPFPLLELHESPGPRWFLSFDWDGDPRRGLRLVTLRFGELVSEPFTDITVFAKLPRRDLGEGASVPALDLERTMDHGLIGIGMRIAEKLAASEAIPPHKAAQRVDEHYASVLGRFGSVNSPLWRTAELSIDGRAHRGHVAGLEDVWTVVADVGSTFVEISGGGVAPHRLVLRTVQSLEAYPVPRFEGVIESDDS